MKPSRPKLYLNLYWHMHQPDYRDMVTDEYVLPWTYLHAMKDYSDMAFHLEENPKARVSFNFVPILLDQLDDYSQQFKQNTIRDPLLALLVEPHLADINQEQCRLIVQSCFKSHHEKMLSPFPHYQRLLQLFQIVEPMMTVEELGQDQFHYLSAQYKADLLVWYHLAWCGESLRRNNTVIQALMTKGGLFTIEERQQLFTVIGETITGLIPRYKALMEAKQIEISTTPYYHPILPLLLDFKSTLDAMPDAPLPESAKYPGGQSRAAYHVVSAKKSHSDYFGEEPRGMWPAEGGVSHAALSLMAEHGLEWAATGQGVLANSLIKSKLSVQDKHDYLYQPYRVTNGKHDILCFFRDDQLSDKIGFEYAKMHSSDAVSDFILTLEHAHKVNTSNQAKVVSVILDGENAWEYYPYNGYYFLNELYAALANHPDIEMTTFSDMVDLYHSKPYQTKGKSAPILPQVAAGSWVYGTFSTWIGSKDKNLAWDLLCEAKKTYDKVMSTYSLEADQRLACERQLAICEGSDWFWWFGDYNSSDSVASFDKLYRRNLINLYTLLKQPVPVVLNMSISAGGGDADNAGTMRRGTA
ncbi:MAG TPA: glycoside hydrolase family 57 protein [Methylotenera sp.]|nr:glycoside hydrolase family 57 protein [Methylotenera sp.]